MFIKKERDRHRKQMYGHQGGKRRVGETGRLGLTYIHYLGMKWASQMALVVKNPPANAGGVRDEGLIPGLGRYPGEGNGTPLQYSCLENPTNKGAWWAVVCGIAKSQT